MKMVTRYTVPNSNRPSRKVLKRESSTMNWTRPGGLAPPSTREIVISGGRNPGKSGRPVRAPGANVEASSFGDGGPRRTPAGVSSPRFVGATPSGTEVSSGAPNVRRSRGRGVEKATGTTRAGTPGNPGPSIIHTRFQRHSHDAARAVCVLVRGRHALCGRLRVQAANLPSVAFRHSYHCGTEAP
jgi:hypothetical protein